jgi:NAD(P)-dependent dehydrogenase (short-subunit alcohol dehydrogenase family)
MAGPEDTSAIRIALVTGASRGIGRACAVALARRGVHVVGVARSEKALQALDDEIAAFGGAATFAPLDVKDYPALDRLGGVIHERWGKLDLMIAAAGGLGELMPVHQFPPKMFEETIAVNLIANARLIRSMDPLLRAAKGRAAFLTSARASTPQAFWGAEGAAKAGLENLVRAYAAEAGFAGVQACLIDPGPTATALRYKAFPGEDQTTLKQPEDIGAQIVDLLMGGAGLNGARFVLQPAAPPAA